MPSDRVPRRLQDEKVADVLTQRKPELERLCRQFQVRRLEAFGSAATGRYVPGKSDLDILVEFAPMARGAYADAYFGLREALEQLFGRPIDLVVASAITNPYFRQSVEETRVLLYAA